MKSPAARGVPLLLLALALLSCTGCHDPRTFYVRTDGGTPLECTGLADAPYPGSGQGKPCAWDHPFRALPPDGAPRLLPGDTLIIGPGSYRMGFGAPGAEACSSYWPDECSALPVPPGWDASRPTRILGAGWDQGCPDPPELWGTEHARRVLDLRGSGNVEIACLELTDHSGCVYAHGHGFGVATTWTCKSDSYPFGDWAYGGIVAEDASNVLLKDLDIHGFAAFGVHAGRLADWDVQNVRIAANGWVGWDGDIYGDDASSGRMDFRNVTVEWNGCAESYPGGSPQGCWAQSAGGYGDGLGTGFTGGAWSFTDCRFLHNTSDGLDLLYLQSDSMVEIETSWFEGNAGNQVKISGSGRVSSSVLAGNCTFFEGQPFTYHVDPCRALGNTLEWKFSPGDEMYLLNATFYGEGDGLVSAGSEEPGTCDGSEWLMASGCLFLGGDDFLQPWDLPFLFYQETCPGMEMYAEYSLAHHVKNEAAPWVDPPFPGAGNLWADPLLDGPLSGPALGLTPLPGSPAVDPGPYTLFDLTCPSRDVLHNPRPVDGDGDGEAHCDVGALEYAP